MGMFVEEKTFKQLRTGYYIQFVNEISGNDESGTVVWVNDRFIQVSQWDKGIGGDVMNTYREGDISNIVRIK